MSNARDQGIRTESVDLSEQQHLSRFADLVSKIIAQQQPVEPNHHQSESPAILMQ